MARARRVLPTPGTSSSRTWPPASRAMSESPTASSLPSSTVFMAVRAREVRCWTHSMCCAPITELVCVPSWLIDIPSIVPYGRHSGHTRFSQVPRAPPVSPPPSSTTESPFGSHPPPRQPPHPAPHFPPHGPSTFLPTSIHLGDGNPRNRRVLADLGA